MSEQLITIVLGAIVLVTSLAAWIAGMYYVRWDAGRRGLPGWQRLLWLVLALWPLVGLTVYVLAAARASTRLAAAVMPRKRVTLPRPPEAFRRRLPTMPVPEGLSGQPLVPTAPVAAVARPEPRPASPPPPAPQYVLSVLEGPYAGQEFLVRELPARIGRGAEAAIRLDQDLGVSRRHAELYHQGGVLRLRDNHSAHGTAVNGLTIDDKGLMPGDQIRVGHSLLTVHVSGGAGGASPTPQRAASGPGDGR